MLTELSQAFSKQSIYYIDSLDQDHENSIANALELLYSYSLQNKCQTTDPDWQNLGWSGKLSFFIIYKFRQNCA